MEEPIKRTIIQTKNAPDGLGPFNQAILVNQTMYISGQLGLIPETSEFVEGGVTEQAFQAMKNIQAILKSAKSDLCDIVQATVLLKNIDDFTAVNEVYGKFFTTENHPPSRSAFQVVKLPLDGLVEIVSVAYIGAGAAHNEAKI